MRRIVEDLVTRSSLIIGLFGSTAISDCSADDHRGLLGAITRGDGEQAKSLMLDHLSHIERELQIGVDRNKVVDLHALFNG